MLVYEIFGWFLLAKYVREVQVDSLMKEDSL